MFESQDVSSIAPQDRGAILISDLQKTYAVGSGQKIHAVDSLDIDLNRGQVLALLGSNGAGKTTVISMLSCLMLPDDGSISIFGQTLPTRKNQSPNIGITFEVQKLLGVCRQSDVLLDVFSAVEHLELFAAVRGLRVLGKIEADGTVVSGDPDALQKEYIFALMEDVSLASKCIEKAGSYSVGMKRKLSLAIALLGNPSIVVLDEPTSGMDVYSRNTIWQLIQDSKENKVIILTTHSMEEADILGDRVAIMSKGKLKALGSPLFLKDRFGTGYRLSLIKNGLFDQDGLTQFIQSFIATAEVLENSAHNITYLLPDNQEAYPDFFEALEGLLSANDTYPEEKKEIDTSTEDQPQSFYRRFRLWFHLLMFLVITGLMIGAWILHGKDSLVLSLLWAFVSLKLMFYHVTTRILSKPLGMFFGAIFKVVFAIPEKIRLVLGVLLPVGLIVSVTLALPIQEGHSTRMDRLRSLLGLVIFIGVLFATSNNRKLIPWRTVVVGVLLQFLLGLFILKTSVGYDIFSWLSNMCSTLLHFSKSGLSFVTNDDIANIGIFVFTVLPAVIFFAAIVKVVYYLGGMQWIVRKFAWLMVRLMGTSGAESVVAAASPFVGMGESSLLILPFLETLTRSELHSAMTSGFATISGSVLVAFISMKVDAQTLITSCVMSVPCGLAISKMRYPETGEPVTKGKVRIPESEDKEANFLHAASNGAAQGIHLALLILATVISFISLLALVNSFLTWVGNFFNIDNLTLEFIVGYLFYPFMWLVGIPNRDLLTVARLMATKMFVNEFAAFAELANLTTSGALEQRTASLGIYCLCGFANFGSIGIQIGALGAMAPSRKKDLAELAFSAMLCGTMSTLMSATIAGMLL
ncbi:hypothetical protein K493DRAFT_364895 [Basidiobolus meristosporus CBS 931.73]|nr:hypothetical protein K493DRAFT_364895 [Basidiobolus meristosporus CBS 931.73]|eukprot:ORX64523.1 hypothetical protein K493DRAFT_364895 [Basidiobolus meristosporus CBS 931.73]